MRYITINPLNAELNPICHLLAFVGARHIVHVSRIWVKPPISCHVERTCDHNLGPQSVISLLHVLNILKKWELSEIVEDFDAGAY
jgi:hypothetical protein